MHSSSPPATKYVPPSSLALYLTIVWRDWKVLGEEQLGYGAAWYHHRR